MSSTIQIVNSFYLDFLLNLADLVEFFEDKKIVKKEESNEEKKVIVQKVSLIDDDKRVNALNISVKKLTDMMKLSFEDLRQMVLTFDDGTLGFDGLTALSNIAPSKEEINKVKDYKGEVDALDIPSRWIWEMKDVPFFKERLDFFVFSTDFDKEYKCRLSFM